MPQITPKDDTYGRVVEFKQVIKAIISQELDFDECLTMTLD